MRVFNFERDFGPVRIYGGRYGRDLIYVVLVLCLSHNVRGQYGAIVYRRRIYLTFGPGERAFPCYSRIDTGPLPHPSLGRLNCSPRTNFGNFRFYEKRPTSTARGEPFGPGIEARRFPKKCPRIFTTTTIGFSFHSLGDNGNVYVPRA